MSNEKLYKGEKITTLKIYKQMQIRLESGS